MKHQLEQFSKFFHLPIRIYRGKEMVYHSRSFWFEIDLAQGHRDTFQQLTKELSFFSTEDLLYFGVIKHQEDWICIGPACGETDIDLLSSKLALHLPIASELLQELKQYLHALPCLNIAKFADILCFIYNNLYEKNMSSEDLLIADNFNILNEKTLSDHFLSIENTQELVREKHQTDYENEKQLLSYVRQGNFDKLKKYLLSTHFKNDYLIGDSQLRNQKNIAIVSITLVTRAAIEGGLDVTTAFNMSDLYIRQIEQLKNINDINNAMITCVLEFTERVGGTQLPDGVTPLIGECCRYVRRNLHTAITTKSIAHSLHVSTAYLSTLFSKEMHMTLNYYIHYLKIEEAKWLLTKTKRDIIDIALYLCYTSQSYFQKVFKKYTGLTPLVYRHQKAS